MPLPTEPSATSERAAPAASARGARARLAALAAGLVMLAVAAWAMDLHARLDVEHTRALVEGAGTWGILLFVALWVLGSTMNLPPVGFIVVAALVWGPARGGLIAYVATLISLSVAFGLVRHVGRDALVATERPWLRRALAHVDAHPVRTTARVRITPLFLAPFVTYALALTSMRYRDFAIGSALGVIPGITVIASGASTLLAWWLAE